MSKYLMSISINKNNQYYFVGSFEKCDYEMLCDWWTSRQTVVDWWIGNYDLSKGQ